MKDAEKACTSAATLLQAKGNSQDEIPPTGDYTIFEGKVATILNAGAENAISAEYLCTLLGFNSVRALRKEIQKERRQGALILSNNERGGYYLPGSVQEVEAFKRFMENRAKSTFLSIKSARQFLKEQGEQACGSEK